MKHTRLIAAALILLTAVSSCKSQEAKPKSLKDMGSVDQLLAPIALYPDPLLAQILMSSLDPPKVTEFDKWLDANKSLKGSHLQDAAVKDGFDPSLVALALFPTVVAKMADQIAWTTLVGQAFKSDKSSVFDAIQRLRKQASDVGTLKTTPQQAVSSKKTSAGSDVIVIEPANPQVVYVPQYNPEVVYTQAPAAAPATTSSTTVVVVEDDDNSAEMLAAGLIGFTAGIVIGASASNPYYYGPYGWHGGGYMYAEAWDDYYDHREDAREDWMDHREEIVEERGDRARDRQENVTDRRQNTQEQRTERRAEGGGAQRAESAAAQRSAGTQRAAGERPTASSATAQSQRSTERQGSAASRGYGERSTTAGSQSTQRSSSSSSSAFSGYSSGSSERASSSRGQRSVSSSRSSGGGSRSRGGR